MEIQPTNDDRQRVRASVENAREHMFEVLVSQEARLRVERERSERRRARLRRLTFGLLGR